MIATVSLVWLLGVLTYALPGDLDPTFGGAGMVTTLFNPGSTAARGIAIQSDGRIVAVGGSGGRFAIARFSADGTLDTSFDGDGKATTAVGIFDEAFAVALQSDGKIVAAGGTSPSGFCCQIALVRYNANGSLDAAFDGDGKVITPFGGDTRAFGVAIQADGRIVVAGGTSSPFGGDFAVARYNTNGSLDGSFGTGGRITTDLGGFDMATGVLIQPDGKIVAAGSGGANDFAIARYNADGSLDITFGVSGKVTTDFGGFDRGTGVALQSDGKIVVAGNGGFFTRFAVARYNPDGTLDAGFDGDGKVTTGFFGESIESASALAVQQNGKIVVVGAAITSFDSRFALARYNADGSLDSGFGTGGTTTTDIANPGNDIANGVAVQPDGMIVVVGGTGACNPPCGFAVARYIGDAPVDTTPPVITPHISGTAGLDGWYTSDVTVSWTVIDDDSAITDQNGCSDTSVTTDTAGETFTCSATSDGGTSSVSVTVKRDATAPSMECAANPTELWPPTMQLVAVHTSIEIIDAISGPAGFILDRLATNEGEVESDMADWQLGTSDSDGLLRAYRIAENDGRIYALSYEGTDGAGNTATCSVNVLVRHDQRALK